ncbi:MAG: PEP/pyruvate-binding domain-containing protein, partial [Bacteriovoracaceae bacterium]
MILNLNSPFDLVIKIGGAKSLKLYELAKRGCRVPEFIVISNEMFREYLQETNLLETVSNILDPKEGELRVEKAFLETPLPEGLQSQIKEALESEGLLGQNLAARSSGIDEDSVDHSFAGMFSSFLFQKEFKDIELSIRKCWASAYSERALSYRIKNRMELSQIKMGVVIQKMINSEISGVMFTRNPMDPLDRDNMVVDSLFGQCEALVSGELDADHYKIKRDTKEIKQNVVEKEFELIQSKSGPGLEKVPLAEEKKKQPSLAASQLMELVALGLDLEAYFRLPMDVEWAIEDGKLYVLQS